MLKKKVAFLLLTEHERKQNEGKENVCFRHGDVCALFRVRVFWREISPNVFPTDTFAF